MSARAETKPLIYHYIRRGHWGHVISLCDPQGGMRMPSGTNAQQGNKDPASLFWKSFAMGMDSSSGALQQCIAELESYQARRDMQYPVTLALIYFMSKIGGVSGSGSKSQVMRVDEEAITALKAERQIAEDVCKEAGLLLAARFCLFTGDLKEARRLSKKILRGSDTPSTPIELDAMAVDLWAHLVEAERMATRSKTETVTKVTGRVDRALLQPIEAFLRSRGEEADIDALMLLARSRQVSGSSTEAVNALNQVIAVYPGFVPGLTEKAAILAAQNDWEQALDTVQRALDVDRDNLDALKIIAVHAFKQESQPHDALQKLDDLDAAITNKDPNSTTLAFEFASLFSRICSRHPRALQLCQRHLEKACRLADEAEMSRNLCELGHCLLLQGAVQDATKAFQRASKRDSGSVMSLQGMIQCQVLEGHYDDAEAQVELFQVMHGGEGGTTAEFVYYQAIMALHSGFGTSAGAAATDAQRKEGHLALLEKSKSIYLERATTANDGSVLPMHELVITDPDFLLQLAVGYQAHIEAHVNMSFGNKPGGADDSADQNDQPVAATMTLMGASSAMGATLAGGLTLMGGATLTSTTSASGNSASQNAKYSRTGQGTGHVEVPPAVQSGIELMKRLQKLMPGMIAAYVEMSRFLVSIGQHEEACRNLRRCLSLQPHCVPALVAMAHVELSRGGTAAADRCLEQALSGDFSIRSCTLFRLLTAQVRAQQGRLDVAIPEIEQLVQLIEVREIGTTAPGATQPEAMGKKKSATDALSSAYDEKSNFSGPASNRPIGSSVANAFDPLRLTDDDRVSVFVLYASLLSRAKRLKEAHKVLSDAKVIFAGRKQEVQVLVAASQLAVERSDFEAAVRMLDKIKEESPIFVRAQTIKADVMLNYMRDKEGYTSCFQKLVDMDRGSSKYQSMLGEAFLKILNPESAVTAFESAYRLDPKNSKLRARIGRALVATHEYHRAIDFYEAALRDAQGSSTSSSGLPRSATAGSNAGDGSFASLSHDLAKLYIKLENYPAAVKVLQKVLSSGQSQSQHGGRDLQDLRMDVQSLLMLVEIERIIAKGAAERTAETSAGQERAVVEYLKQARDVQKQVVSEVRTLMSSSDAVEAEKLVLSVLCEQLGGSYMAVGDLQEADGCITEALNHNPHNTAALYTLAELSKRRGDVEKCKSLCTKIVSADPTHEAATVMLSDMHFASDSPDDAIKPLQTLLEALPNNYRALAKLIQQLRRAGKLEQAPPFITAAEANDKRSGSHAGLRYCKGLYSWYTNDIIKAVGDFNLARRDTDWGPEALEIMIQLYLNPDQEGAWEEKEGVVASNVLDDSMSNNLAVVERLLQELKLGTRNKARYAILENYYLLATKQKAHVESAMKSFIEMLEADPDNLSAVLGMATGFMIEKSQHKARNLLKRVAKMEQKLNDGEDFEKANLLLAKFYVDQGKADLAKELCKRCLSANKSCSQAWEILGLAFEKESLYDQAAECYEKAWKLEFEASATVGFKYAFCLLKIKNAVGAIDVCEKVLDQYPEYPRIRDEILKKALLQVRSFKA